MRTKNTRTVTLLVALSICLGAQASSEEWRPKTAQELEQIANENPQLITEDMYQRVQQYASEHVRIVTPNEKDSKCKHIQMVSVTTGTEGGDDRMGYAMREAILQTFNVGGNGLYIVSSHMTSSDFGTISKASVVGEALRCEP